MKPYAHEKYKFVVRAKLGGKWKRSYFRDEDEAIAFARQQNATLPGLQAIMEQNELAAPHNLPGAGKTFQPLAAGRVFRQKAVVVLGMHRSGTSAVAGALSCLAIDFGHQLTPGSEDNSKGYWEHTEIVALHEELLRGLQTRWDDDKPLPAGWLDQDATTEIESLLIGIIKRDFDHAPLFGLKDPRMCRLVPMWLRIFKKLEIDPYFVLPIRHPFEVAESLAKRDGMDHAKSYLLWLNHLVEAESATRGEKRSFVCYDAFLTDPVGTLSTAQKILGLDFRSPSDTSATLRSFVEPSLRHHDSRQKSMAASKVAVPTLALEIFDTLCSSTEAGGMTGKIESLTTQFVRAADLFYPRLGLIEGELAAIDLRVPSTDDTSSPEQLVRLEVFHPTSAAYRAGESQTRFFASGSWKALAIDLPGRKQSGQVLRLDPVSYPAVVDIGELVLKNPVSGEVVWQARNTEEFDAFQVAGTASRLENSRYLRILSFGGDPQVLFPAATSSLLTAPLRLELSIRVDGTTEALQSAVSEKGGNAEELASALEASQAEIGRQSQALNAAAEVAAQLEAAQGRLAILDAASGSWQRTFADLQLAIDASRAELSRVTYHAEAREAHITKLQTEVDRQQQENREVYLQLEAARESAAVFQSATAAAEAKAAREAQTVEELNRQAEEAKARIASLEQAESEARSRIGDLQASFAVSEQAVKRATEESAVKDSEIASLHRAVQEAKAESAHLADEIGRGKLQAQRDRREIEGLQAALRNAIEKGRTDATHLTTALEKQIRDKEQLGRDLEVKTQTIADFEEQVATLNVGLEAARSQWNEISTELREASLLNSQLQDQRQLDAEQIQRLHEQQHDLRSALEKSESERDRLAAVIDIQHTKNRGLEIYRARLEKKLQAIGQSLFLAGQQIRKGDGTQSSIIDSISQDIRSIARPSVAWKTGEAVGLLRLAPVGMPRNAGERESVAHDLEMGLQDISEALAAAKKAPELAASQLSRLFDLQRQTRALLRAFSLWGPPPSESSIWNLLHWPRRAKADVSVTNDVGALFDPAWYLGQNADVASSDFDPAEHYFLYGAREGRNPNPVFDAKRYLAKNPGLDPATMDPLTHYCTTGVQQGLNPNPLFDSAWYLALNPDVSTTGLNPLAHFLTYGVKEQRDPHPLFDCRWYCSMNPEVSGTDALGHYLTCGGRLGLTPHPLFDPHWYVERYPEIAAAGLDPFIHYVEFGAAEGRTPHPLFDPAWYLRQTQNSAEAAFNPLRHYVMFGAAKRLSPSPHFDPEYYAAQYPDARNCPDLLRHYLAIGSARGYRPSPSFDPQLYFRAHPNLRASGMEPLTAFARSQALPEDS